MYEDVRFVVTIGTFLAGTCNFTNRKKANQKNK